MQVTDEDVEKEIQILAAQAQQPADVVRARLVKEGGLDRIKNKLRTDKAMNFLYEKATA